MMELKPVHMESNGSTPELCSPCPASYLRAPQMKPEPKDHYNFIKDKQTPRKAMSISIKWNEYHIL